MESASAHPRTLTYMLGPVQMDFLRDPTWAHDHRKECDHLRGTGLSRSHRAVYVKADRAGYSRRRGGLRGRHCIDHSHKAVRVIRMHHDGHKNAECFQRSTRRMENSLATATVALNVRTLLLMRKTYSWLVGEAIARRHRQIPLRRIWVIL